MKSNVYRFGRKGMKIGRANLLCILLLTGSNLLWANSYPQTISLRAKNMTLVQVLKEVRIQTGFSIIYNDKLVADAKRISIDAKKMPFEMFLRQVLSSSQLTYMVSQKSILIQKTGNPIPGNSTVSASLSSETATKQQQEIIGKVKDENGQNIAGVSIKRQGKKLETQTDKNGQFNIEANEGEILQISSVGYQMQQIRVGTDKFLNIVLKRADQNLDEVVVTALGIKREEKKLGYAQQTIKAQDLAASPAPNWSSGLMGKVAGLTIVSGATGPLSSQKIQLRGTSSLNAAASGALIVIDGVPMNQEITTYGNNAPAAYGTDAPVDYGNAISELNQDDIASVTVLKGPSAAALYGSRAANGVLVITTKSGERNQKLGISFGSNLTMDHIINWPEYNYEYGGGSMTKNENGEFYFSFGNSADGVSTQSPTAFGPKFDGQSYFQYDPETQAQGTERTLWKPYKNNRKDLFRKGFTTENMLTLQGGNEKGSMRVGVTHTDNKYILPNTGYQKNSVSFNGNYQISNNIKLSATANYNNRSSDNLPAYGLSNGSLGYFLMFLMPNVDINWYKPIWANGKENLKQLNPFSDWSENPYFILYQSTNALQSHQLVGSTRADVKITDHLSFMGRLAINQQTQLRETNRAYSSQKYPKGYYGRQDVSSIETNTDFLLRYNNKFNDDFKYEIMGGGNHMSYTHRDVMSSVTGLVTPGIYKLSNGINNPLVKTNDALKEINSFYGMGSLSWKDRLFLDVTGRNDWSSTLPTKNNAYFYPSVTASAIVSSLVQLPKSISFLKYRLSYAKVGSDASPYQTAKYYAASSFPSSAVVPGTLYNLDLKPEITAGWETGFDLKLLDNRLGLDLTYYKQKTNNQILSVPSDIVTGYSSRVINAGAISNEGVEAILIAVPVKNKNIEWTVTMNWSLNRNKVLELTDGVEQQTLASLGGGWIGYIIATKGGTTSDLWGPKMVRDPEGNVVYANGVPTYTSTNEYIGRTTPDWKAGITNTVRYKNFRFTATLDGQWKGLIKSGSFQRASWDGFTAATIPGRDVGTIVGDGVMKDANGNFVPNTQAVLTQTYYGQYYSHAADVAVFDASFIKIRELAVAYSVPLNKGNGKHWIKTLTLNAYGRNLAVFDKNFPWYDPEAGMQNGQVFIQGAEMSPMPLTASFGFGLKADF